MKPFSARLLLPALAFSTLYTSAAMAQTSTIPPSAAASTPLQEILRGAVNTPSPGKNAAGSSRFTPASEKLLFMDSITAKMTLDTAQKAAFQKYVRQVVTVVEGAYTRYGYAKNDLGVAFGALLETCYEMDKGTYKTGDGTEQDRQKTRAAVSQMQRAFGNAPALQNMSSRSKQLAYESATFLAGHLALQWQQAGDDAAKKEAVRQMARRQIVGLFRLDPDGVTRLASGAFAANRAAVASASIPTDKTSAASHGPLPAAALGGARIFVKYRLQYSTYAETKFDHLILFPDGAAFDDLPSKPMTEFSEASLRATLKPFYIGTWKQSGNTIVLSFPADKSEPQRTLLKHPKGWYDGKALPKESTAYDTYYPVIIPNRRNIVGSWKSSSLTTMGSAGGGSPMVAAGSNGNRTYRADGTFSDAKESFFSATTANMGDGFKTGGDVTTAGGGNKSGVGRWRLDGPLLTMERNGVRTVHIAFVMPNWSTDPKSQGDIMIDGDNWEHPKK